MMTMMVMVMMLDVSADDMVVHIVSTASHRSNGSSSSSSSSRKTNSDGEAVEIVEGGDPQRTGTQADEPPVMDLGKIVKKAVEAQNMLAWQFNTIGVSDGITMGSDGEFRAPCPQANESHDFLLALFDPSAHTHSPPS